MIKRKEQEFKIREKFTWRQWLTAGPHYIGSRLALGRPPLLHHQPAMDHYTLFIQSERSYQARSYQALSYWGWSSLQNYKFLLRSVIPGGRVEQSVEPALSSLSAIFSALSPYFNNFRQKISYYNLLRQKRVLCNFATKQCSGMQKMWGYPLFLLALSLSCSGSLWLSVTPTLASLYFY